MSVLCLGNGLYLSHSGPENRGQVNSTNYLIDTKAGVIVDVEATPAHRTDEVNATRIMVDRVEERFEIKPTHLIGDTAYGTAEMLGWMVDEKAIDATSRSRRTVHPNQKLGGVLACEKAQ